MGLSQLIPPQSNLHVSHPMFLQKELPEDSPELQANIQVVKVSMFSFFRGMGNATRSKYKRRPDTSQLQFGT